MERQKNRLSRKGRIKQSDIGVKQSLFEFSERVRTAAENAPFLRAFKKCTLLFAPRGTTYYTVAAPGPKLEILTSGTFRRTLDPESAQVNFRENRQEPE